MGPVHLKPTFSVGTRDGFTSTYVTLSIIVEFEIRQNEIFGIPFLRGESFYGNKIIEIRHILDVNQIVFTRSSYTLP